ncbi:MAG: efflux RND transporter periplasmic adaptor subunit [Longimicrobiales bacterium]
MPEEETSSIRMPRARWIVAIALVLVALFAARRLTAPMEVRTAVVERRDIVETLAVVGRVRAPARAALGVSSAGNVTAVRAREGDRVARGDVLVTLDEREAEAAVREAEAALEETSATAGSAVEEAERDAAQSARDLDRIRSVVSQGGLNQQQLEQAEQRAADAASRLEALRAGTGEDGAPASVARAVAAVEAARARLALKRVTAPGNGVILARMVEAGDAVAPGQVLLEMALDGPSELVVFPGEENLGRLTLGAAAVASADAFPDRTFAAVVSLIAPSVDPSQGTVEVRLAISDPPEWLLPDMTVSVNIESGRKLSAAVVPEDAVQGLGTEQPWVAVVRDGRLTRQDVTVGLRPAGFVEIASGLGDDESVALSVEADDVGSRARIVPAAASSGDAGS